MDHFCTETLLMLGKIVESMQSELRRLCARVESEIVYYQRRGICGEKVEVLVYKVLRYTDARELCTMFLEGALPLNELIDELKRLNLNKYVWELSMFNPKNSLCRK